MCAYVFLLYRRCAGQQENGRIAASPFLFRGLPAWSPAFGAQSPQVPARGGSPGVATWHAGVASWDTPEEKVRRTNSSRNSCGRDPARPLAQPGQQAVDDDNGKGHGGVFANAAQALVRLGLSFPGAATLATPRSCQVANPAPAVEAIP